MKLRFARLHPDAVIPTRGTPQSAGLDLTAVERISSVHDEDILWFDTHIAVAIPEGFVGLIFPRSNITKRDLLLGNSVGVIDSDYRGSIQVRFDATGSRNHYREGDRVAQLVIVAIPEIDLVEVDTLDETERNSNGFGSTG